MIDEPRGAFTSRSSTILVLFFWALSWSITHRFRVPERFPRLTIPVVRSRVRPEQSQFWPILARFLDYYSPFWGPKAISMDVELQGALTCRSSTIIVWADSGPFLGLLISFGGPGVISMNYEAWGVFTCWSSTLAVLADSGPFDGLLLTVLGSRSDFHSC